MATNKKKGQRTQAKQLYAAIDEYINNQGNKTFNYKQVSHAIGVDSPAAGTCCGSADSTTWETSFP